MVMFAESDYNAEEHARLLEALWGKQPEGEVNLIEGDEDEVTLKGLPAEEPKE
jgi:hypothetical protein